MQNLVVNAVTLEKRLQNITFHLQSGEFVGLVGANGSGKTTLLRIMSGLLPPNSGDVILDGVVIDNTKYQPVVRQSVVMIHADPEVQLVASSVFEEIAFGLRMQNISYDTLVQLVAKTLKDFEFDNLRNDHPFFLSAGQQQRLILASRLITHPHYVLLDEVTSMLDIHSRTMILNYLKRMSREHNIGIMLATHRLEDLLEADKIAVLYKGDLVAYDSVLQIMKRVQAHPEWGIALPPLSQLALNNPQKNRLLSNWLPNDASI